MASAKHATAKGMRQPVAENDSSVGPLRAATQIVRPHILAIASAACLVFGWLTTGRHPWLCAVFAAVDWFLINLLNRVTDVDEDLANAIDGAELVARRRRGLTALCATVAAGSFVASHFVAPTLTPWRIAVQAIGLGYNYRLIPWPGGRRRLKELYFLKNAGSAAIFVLTGFVYPLAVAPAIVSTGSLAALIAFFVPFEITYEIAYDLRDVEGDRAASPPIATYPVAHGPEAAVRIIHALLAIASLTLAGALGLGAVGVREGLMLAAPAVQLTTLRSRTDPSSEDCTRLTWIGAGLLVFYLAGTAAWSTAGLPENIFLR